MSIGCSSRIENEEVIPLKIRPYDPTCDQNTILFSRYSATEVFSKFIEELERNLNFKIDQNWPKISFVERKKYEKISHTEEVTVSIELQDTEGIEL